MSIKSSFAGQMAYNDFRRVGGDLLLTRHLIPRRWSIGTTSAVFATHIKLWCFFRLMSFGHFGSPSFPLSVCEAWMVGTRIVRFIGTLSSLSPQT